MLGDVGEGNSLNAPAACRDDKRKDQMRNGSNWIRADTSSTGRRDFRRIPRLLPIRRTGAVVTSTASLLLLTSACGSAQAVHDPTGGRDGQLTGRISVCRTFAGRCSPAAATITIHRVLGSTLGPPLASRDARTGRFRFSVPPGQYFPSASDVRPKLAGARCISGDVIVKAGRIVRDEIRCFPRVRSKALNPA